MITSQCQLDAKQKKTMENINFRLHHLLKISLLHCWAPELHKEWPTLIKILIIVILPPATLCCEET